jgi:rhodanese-related sulfurtransferase
MSAFPTCRNWAAPLSACSGNSGRTPHLEAEGVSRDRSLLLICRSGVRSRDAAVALTSAGFGPCYNISDGFEGDLDGAKHRGISNGWKVADLPWIQQ